MTTVSPSGNTTAAVTYTPIATNTLSSSTATLTFSSIPGTYNDLVIVVNGTHSNTVTANLKMQFNSDTGSNYSATRLLGNGSAASSARQSSTTYMMVGDINNAIFTSIFNIQNYANTTTYKTALARTGNASAYLGAYVGLWRSTSAITSVDIAYDGTGTFASGTTFTLYGIGA